MKYCTICGQTITDNQTFCTSCGAKQGDEEQAAKHEHTPEVSPSRPVQERRPKKPMAKNKKIALISIAAALVILTSAHFIISSIIDPLKNVQAMDRAITEQDPDAFFEQVDLKEKALVDKEEYLSFIDSSGWESMRYQLIEGFEGEQGKTFDFSIRDEAGDKVFAVKKDPLVPGLYSTYDIEAIPNQVVAASNMENTKVTIEGKTKEIKEASDFTDLNLAYPGEYSVEGTAQSEFGTFEYSDTLTVYPNEGNESEVMIDFPSNTYAIDTNQQDAILFINGESTEQPLSEYTELGPFPTDEQVTVHAEWKDEEGNTHTTDEVDPQSSMWGALSFYFDEPTEEVYAGEQTNSSNDAGFDEEEVEDFMLQFLDQSVEALNVQDFTIVAPLFNDDGSGKAESQEFIESGRVDTETLLDGELIDLVELEEDEFEVTMSESYEIYYSDGDFKEPTLESTYLLTVEDGELKVDSYVSID
ncbi:TcaA NTF2-like domain-containing protein [Halobacillus campisalis]|uniref:Zinc-ribbon domain-containing protein n=1 Tax=Halobacillus campisalis TaxID=435909 RepID=A0ABW2K085_9BACI|nr:zinc-ribbon domain-containing protein [Halobacillus campisalis]